MLSSRTVAVVLLMTPPAPSVLAQRSESTASLLLRFDNEHDLSAKEHLLLTVTNKDAGAGPSLLRSEEHTSELQSLRHLVCRLLLEKKKQKKHTITVPSNILTARVRSILKSVQ